MKPSLGSSLGATRQQRVSCPSSAMCGGLCGLLRAQAARSAAPSLSHRGCSSSCCSRRACVRAAATSASQQQHQHAACSPAAAAVSNLLQAQQYQLMLQQQHAAIAAAAAAATAVTAQQARGSSTPLQQAAAPSAPAFAALSRVLLTSTQNANVFRSALSQRRQPVPGPVGVLLFLATLLAASFAAIRSALLRRGKSCKSCRGFGLQRCRLCLGSGRVDWAAKLQHFDVCPLCMNRRFVVCGECGGHYHRPMFAHRRRQAGGTLEPVDGGRTRGGARQRGAANNSGGGFADSGQQVFSGPIVLNLAAAGVGGVTVVTSGGLGGSPQGSMSTVVMSSMSD